MTIPDRYECYERCVQSPGHVASFVRAVHGGSPLVLREDFCGSAAVARRWAAEGAGRGARAVGVDCDPGALEAARVMARAERVADEHLGLRRADAVSDADPSPADVVFVGNFSIGYIHGRAALVRYLAATRARLACRSGDGRPAGVLVFDVYGGAGAFRTGGLERVRVTPGGLVIRYSWRREAADPVSGMVENSVSFRVEQGGEVVREYLRAFEYRWRLWGLPELRDALDEAGFGLCQVYTEINDDSGGRPMEVGPGESLGEDWVVLVAARPSTGSL
ncbi:MAG: class I SAM-dependent methyltransferase [Phycisphaeraceae bacterium]|nr:MAG: class I SAM-dependent methyltransferase [Phycisphaeraceae bacterium]